jgi:Family of unknown function (DUF5309)
MSFTGKATYTAGTTLPESAEDVSDLVSIASPTETPLLDALGDAPRPARSTVHEWLEDSLLPNSDTINDSVYTNATTDTVFTVAHGSRFRVGDLIRAGTSSEVMFVTAVSSNDLTVVRGYGGSTASALSNGLAITILGNASLEGDDAAAARFTSRTRVANYTQIFAATAEISGSEEAVSQIGLGSELTYQANNRLRELLRDLESTVIGGRAAAANPEGNASTRRTMKGLLQFITTNRFTPGSGGFPSDATLTEQQLNTALRTLWASSSARVDLIVVGGQEKRSINNFVASSRRFDQLATGFRQLISSYESDFGVCRIVLSRAVPTGTVLLLDSSRISVLPLAGRSFQFKRLAPAGDRSTGQVVGEYTLELRNEAAHGVITGLTA